MIDEARLYNTDNLGAQGHEEYPGATMSGNIYFVISPDDEPNNHAAKCYIIV